MRLGKSVNQFNFFQVRKIDLWNKMRAALAMIDIGMLIKELGEVKVWIGIKLLMGMKKTQKIIVHDCKTSWF